MNFKKLITTIWLFLFCRYCYAPNDWVLPCQTAYLFAPGIFSSERQIAKYCQQYQASNGQTIMCDTDFRVIQEPFYSVNFPEIVLAKNAKQDNSESWLKSIKPSLYPVLNAITSVIWKLRSNSHDAREKISFKSNGSIPHSLKTHGIDMTNVNLGQSKDIQILSIGYDKLITNHPDMPIVLYGVSRGAATALNFVATAYQKKEKHLIEAMVLESPYDSIESVIDYYTKNIPAAFRRIARSLLPYFFPSYQASGIAPINVVQNLPQNLPILIITSTADTTVPTDSVVKTYEAIKNSGNQHVYLLKLHHSPHPRYMLEHKEDKRTYLETVHAFYKKYNLPHDPRLAEEGIKILQQCQQ